MCAFVESRGDAGDLPKGASKEEMRSGVGITTTKPQMLMQYSWRQMQMLEDNFGREENIINSQKTKVSLYRFVLTF